MEQLSEKLPCPQEKEQDPRQWKIGRVALGFLALMLALTFISRAAASLTVPLVSAESPSSSALAHTVRGTGTIEARQENAVVAKQGLLVSKVFVRPGQQVKEGDPLFTIDLEDLQQQIQQQSLQLQKLQLQAAQTNDANQNQLAQLAIDRAVADYDAVEAEQKKLVKRAKQDLEEAEDRWDEYEEWGEGQFIEGQWQPDDTSYEDAYREKRRAYQDAKDAQEKALQQAQRAIEDAKLQYSKSYSGAITTLDIKEKQIEIQSLSQYQENDGIIKAGQAGTVTKINVAPGQHTSGEASLLMTEDLAGYYFRSVIPAQDAYYLERGRTVSVVTPENKKGIEATIESLQPNAGDKTVELVAFLPQGSGTYGAQGEFTTTQYTKNYDLCVPISALHEDSTGKYVFIMEERSGVLGKEQVAVRISVTLLDKNSEKAAVEGALYRDSRVITSSAKPIGENDKVRLGA